MKRPPPNSRGFSLVEIALCIAIVSFAFLGIVGLLPAGLEVFHNSMNASVTSQIVQRILTEAQQTDFDVLTRAPGSKLEDPPPPYYECIGIRYFDEEGNELPSAKSSASLYHAHAVVQNLPKFPDSSGNNTIEMNDLATVVIQVAVNPAQRPLVQDGATLLWKETAGVSMESHPAIVSHHD